MPAQPDQKMVAVYVEQDERDAFKTLCRTLGTDVSTVLRRFIQTAIQQQSVEFVVARSETSEGASAPVLEPEVLKAVLKRLEVLERSMPKFDVDDLVKMRKEVLDGGFGSLRYRMGVMEAQVQSLGGSIAWETTPNKEVSD
jgi:antitoxin component of RelBE/YafQ-DinJ toxin-antitoxin module